MSRSREVQAVARIVLGGLGLLFAFTALYVAAFHSPRPAGVDVGVVGTQLQAAQVQRTLDAAAHGSFDVRRYATEGRARDALLDTEVEGVVVPGERVSSPRRSA
jgi:hypothetical protein